MTNLQFDTEQEYSPQYASAEPPLFIRWVLATGLVTDEKQAQFVLIGITALALVLAVFLFSSAFSGGIGPAGKTEVPPGVRVTSGFPPNS